ncbi:MAG: chemotaxis protein CheD [Pseudomonadota bacterium]
MNSQSTDIYLQPGDFYFGNASTRIRTLLGSCVAITMWHPTRLIGGMCHYMLPRRNKKTPALEGKYADEVMELFLVETARYKTSMNEYQVKIFGGGNMLNLAKKEIGNFKIAQENVEIALILMSQYGLHVSAQDLGGFGHRTIIFEIATGHVWVRHSSINKS